MSELLPERFGVIADYQRGQSLSAIVQTRAVPYANSYQALHYRGMLNWQRNPSEYNKRTTMQKTDFDDVYLEYLERKQPVKVLLEKHGWFSKNFYRIVTEKGLEKAGKGKYFRKDKPKGLINSGTLNAESLNLKLDLSSNPPSFVLRLTMDELSQLMHKLTR